MMLGACIAALGGPLIDIAFLLLLQTTFSQPEIAGLARLRFAALGASILVAGAWGAFLYARFGTAEVIIGSGVLEIIVGLLVLLAPKESTAPLAGIAK
jgi:hypothetical protein